MKAANENGFNKAACVCKQTYAATKATVDTPTREHSTMQGASAATSAASKRPRRPNFSEVELLAMVTSVAEKQKILFGKFTFDSAATAVKMKASAWQYVTDAVNAVSRVQRDVSDVKTKFKHFKSEVKKKRAKDLQYQRGTGMLIPYISQYEVALILVSDVKAIISDGE